MDAEEQWAYWNSGETGTGDPEEQGVQIPSKHYTCTVRFEKQCNQGISLQIFNRYSPLFCLAAFVHAEHLVRSNLIMGVAQPS